MSLNVSLSARTLCFKQVVLRRFKLWRTCGAVPEHVSNDIYFSSNVRNGLFTSNTVTFENIQIARHWGCDPIVLIGIDHNYPAMNGVEGLERIAPSPQWYFDKRLAKSGDKVTFGNIDRMERGYVEALRASKFYGFSIFNATRGGKLEVFPRMSLEEVIERYPARS